MNKENKKPLSENLAYQRKKLTDLLPLNTPLGIDIHASTYCNIKCIFCLHSSSNPCYDSIRNKMLDFELLKKSIDDMKAFPDKIKALHFCGIGEPLLNKDIVSMIQYAKDANVAQKIDINTNGVLLKNDLSNKLLATNIDFIRISVNGLSDEDFKEFTDSKVNFLSYVDNIKYLYENKKDTKIYIKILDFMVNTQEKQELFYKTFEPICDNISVEHYNECFLDTKGKDVLQDSNLSQRGEALLEQKHCPQPFFKMEILPDGDILPCAESRKTLVIGNAKNSTLSEIWNSKTLNDFRIKMLDNSGYKGVNQVCAECSLMKLCMFNSDNIDSDGDRLLAYYKSRF